MPQHELEIQNFTDEEVLTYLINLNTWEAVSALEMIDDLKQEIRDLKEYIADREPDKNEDI